MSEAKISEAEKYKWHDLWNNPEDLPETDDDVLVYDEHNRNYGVCSYDAFRKRWYTTDDEILGNRIIAWRYIEPFEEESDEL